MTEPDEQREPDKPVTSTNGGNARRQSNAHEHSSMQGTPQVIKNKKTGSGGSTGPRTTQGKERSKFNARKHGFYTKSALTEGESRGEYRELLAGFQTYFDPQGIPEALQVELLTQLHWQLRHIMQAENAGAPSIDSLIKEFLSEQLIQQEGSAGKDVVPTEGAGNSNNLAYVRDRIRDLVNCKMAIEDESCNESEKSRITKLLINLEQQNAIDDRARSLVIGLVEENEDIPTTEVGPDDPDQSKGQMLRIINKELKLLIDHCKSVVYREFCKNTFSILARRIPDSAESDRSMRVRVHLSREIDRTLVRLERLQRRRADQPVSPTDDYDDDYDNDFH